MTTADVQGPLGGPQEGLKRPRIKPAASKTPPRGRKEEGARRRWRRRDEERGMRKTRLKPDCGLAFRAAPLASSNARRSRPDRHGSPIRAAAAAACMHEPGVRRTRGQKSARLAAPRDRRPGALRRPGAFAGLSLAHPAPTLLQRSGEGGSLRRWRRRTTASRWLCLQTCKIGVAEGCESCLA
jgi:hypothetical protein